MRPDRRDDERIYSRRSHPGSGRPPGRWEPEDHRFRGRPVAPSSNDYREDYGEDGRRDDEDFGNFQSYIGSGDGYERGPTYRSGRFGDTSRYSNADDYYDRGERWNRDEYDRTWSHRPERNVNEGNRHSYFGRDWRNTEHFAQDDWRSYGERDARDYEEHRSHGEGLVEKMKSFFGVGPKNYRRSDERIHDEAAEALAHDERLDASDIDLRVANGVVTLTGTVSDRWSKWRAEDRVSHLFGVHDVQNRLEVNREKGFDENQSILRYAGGHKGDEEPVGLGAQANLNSLAGMGSADAASETTGTNAITGGQESNQEGTFGPRGLEGTTSTGGFNNTVVVHPAEPAEEDKQERSA